MRLVITVLAWEKRIRARTCFATSYASLPRTCSGGHTSNGPIEHVILEVVAGMASHELLVDAVSSACPLSLHALLDPFARSRMQARSHKHIQCLSAQLMISRHQHCFTCGPAAAGNPVFYIDKVPATDVNLRFAVRKRR